jgi:hypothetical protein
MDWIAFNFNTETRQGVQVSVAFSFSEFIREPQVGITGGDNAAVGYYAGIIVGAGITTRETGFLIVYC